MKCILCLDVLVENRTSPNLWASFLEAYALLTHSSFSVVLRHIVILP